MKFPITISLLLLFCFSSLPAQQSQPLRVGIAGMTHDHVNGILGRPDKGDMVIVGIVESNPAVVERLAKRYNFDKSLVYSSLEEMIAKTQPEAVAAFGSIYDHLAVVEACAPKGIHVMVEKPLAVSLAHAKKMESLAKKHGIQLLTNYETTWYATHHKAYAMIHEDQAIGELRKIVVHDGHEGPREIGCSEEFLAWLTDPVGNGAGALNDFGCYGANLITWLMHGQRPSKVMAVTQQIKPDIYPKVDDEATILVEYPKTQGIIQASWNWPFGRKDMHIYGKTGLIYCDNRSDLRSRTKGNSGMQSEKLAEREAPYNDAFTLLNAVVKGQISLPAYDLSSLENNMIVVEILEAAKKSARTGKAVKLK